MLDTCAARPCTSTVYYYTTPWRPQHSVGVGEYIKYFLINNMYQCKKITGKQQHGRDTDGNEGAASAGSGREGEAARPCDNTPANTGNSARKSPAAGAANTPNPSGSRPATSGTQKCRNTIVHCSTSTVLYNMVQFCTILYNLMKAQMAM